MIRACRRYLKLFNGVASSRFLPISLTVIRYVPSLALASCSKLLSLWGSINPWRDDNHYPYEMRVGITAPVYMRASLSLRLLSATWIIEESKTG